MRWIREHKLIFTMIILFLVLTVIFAVSVIKGGGGNSVTGIVNKGASVVSGGLSSVAKTVRDNVSGIF